MPAAALVPGPATSPPDEETAPAAGKVAARFPAGERPQRLTVRWPDGSEDVVDTADGLAADTLLTVTR
ncbi:MAG: hypothetical protein OXP69_18070 [Spirochaetaceae bacterium]|nr:hypothetical protein [Spirochaetaceae bacterium]